jgi:hypothetical protein
MAKTWRTVGATDPSSGKCHELMETVLDLDLPSSSRTWFRRSR